MTNVDSSPSDKQDGFEIRQRPDHPRLRCVHLQPRRLEQFFQLCQADTPQSLEYVPYSRFLVAKNLTDAFSPHLGQQLRHSLTDRDSGGLTISIADVTHEIVDFIKFATAIGHLLGVPNHDAMAGTYYARFRVAHEDSSDSYLRQAYRTLTMHTDGTYVAEPTDWLLMMKSFERHAAGGESRLLHLDDWKDLAAFANHSLAKHEFLYRSPSSKQVIQTLKRPTFVNNELGTCISFIDQFAHPESLEEAEFLHDLSTSLETSSDLRNIPLDVGELILINNHFWLHGREAFQQHADLTRELIRLRGRF